MSIQFNGVLYTDKALANASVAIRNSVLGVISDGNNRDIGFNVNVLKVYMYNSNLYKFTDYNQVVIWEHIKTGIKIKFQDTRYIAFNDKYKVIVEHPNA